MDASNRRTRRTYESLGDDDPDSLLDAADVMAGADAPERSVSDLARIRLWRSI